VKRRPESVSLVLGSGGARGLAHIGVIRALEERNLRVHSIAGTSMGAVIGGIYAADELETYIRWVTQLRKTDIVRLLDFSFTRTSLFKGERIIEVLKDLIGDRQIENLRVGFTAVATAIVEQREVWLNKGSLFNAINASIAVPGIFSPVTIDGRLLVDGGLINPVPIAPTLNDATDITVAVNLGGTTEHYRPVEKVSGHKREKQDEGYRAAIGRFVSSLRENETDADEPPGVVDLLLQSFDVMQGSIARLKLAAYAPDIVVEVPRDSCSFFEFHRAEEMVGLGYRNAIAALKNAEL
jgi:NTE family protein